MHVLYIVDFLFVLGRVSKSKFLLLPLLYCLHCLLKFLLLLLQFFHCSTPPPLLIPHCLPKFLLLLSYIHCLPKLLFLLYYKELPQKTRLQSIPIAALCLYNIQHENLVFKKSLSTSIVYVSIWSSSADTFNVYLIFCSSSTISIVNISLWSFSSTISIV